jgi:hypothetical protein
VRDAQTRRARKLHDMSRVALRLFFTGVLAGMCRIRLEERGAIEIFQPQCSPPVQWDLSLF